MAVKRITFQNSRKKTLVIIYNLKYTLILFLTFINISSPGITSNEKTIHQTDKQYSFVEIEQNYPQFPWESFREAALTQWTQSEIKETKIEVLKGGFSSDALFKVHLSFNDYVLRFIGTKRSLNQRKIISQSFTWAGLYAFGPVIRLVDEHSFSFMLAEFLEGRTLRLEDTKNKKILEAIGKILARVHNTPPPKENYQEFSQFTYGQQWYHSMMAEKRKAFGPSILKEAYTYWVKINNEVNQQPFKKTMLHNDPNLRNILLTNDNVTLLDWELAGIGDPRKEVAHAVAWYGLNDKLTRIFLVAYYGREPTNEELFVLEKLKTLIFLEFAWVGLSTLKSNLNQETWNKFYEDATPKTIEDLSILQMKSEEKPSDEVTRSLFLGLLKQFMLEARKKHE